MNKSFLYIIMMLGASACSASAGNSDEITLYFARHGETLLNKLEHVQGWADAPLTDEGRKVARYLGEGLKNIPFDQFYSGDSGRQRDTLNIILSQAGRSSEAKFKEFSGLRESFFGSFEGLRAEEMFEASAQVLGLPDTKALLADMVAGKVSIKKMQDAIAAADPKRMAENYQQVKTRTHTTVSEIINSARENKDRNILIVTSGMTIMNLVYELTDKPLQIKPLSNAAVVKITYSNGKYKVIEPGTLRYVNNGKLLLAD